MTDTAGLQFDTIEMLNQARQTVDVEAEALASLRQRLAEDLLRAAQLLLNMRGTGIATGVGKSAVVARKIAGTLASTGTPCHYMSSTDALHGGLGAWGETDCAILVSNSGETAELLALLPSIRRRSVPIIAVCGRARSTLSRAAAAVLDASVDREACPLGLVPTASVLVAMALGDALAAATMTARRFTSDDYARAHPGGALGKRLTLTVADLMHCGDDNPTVHRDATVLDALLAMSASRIRGVVSVVDGQGRLEGVFTDGDFRVIMQRQPDWSATAQLPVATVMTRDPLTVTPDTMASAAANVLRDRQIDNLPVVGPRMTAVGLLDIQDIVSSGLG